MNTTVDWPVERTARRAAGQTDGVLSDINFGEVFPFVAKPLSRDSLARYIGPMLGGQVAGLSHSDPLVLDLNPMAFVAGRPFMDLSAYINLPSIAYQLHLLEAVDRSKGRAIAELARAKRLNPVPIPVTARLTLHLAYARMGLRSLRWLLRRRTPVSLDLWALAQAARPLADVFENTPPEDLARALQTTEEGRRWWMRFEQFLDRHGHRGEVELDLSTPRWREDPTFLLQTVINYLRHPAGAPSPPAMLAEGQRRREAAAEAVRRKLPLPLRGLFTWLYERYVLWLPFREAMKYTWLLGLEQARRVYRELGRRLVAAGHLKTADDVFWLRQDEVRAWAETRTVSWTQDALNARAREWREWTTRRPPSLIIGTRGAPDAASPVARPPQAMVLRGTPVSTGHAEGVARGITDPHHAQLRPGEGFVTRYTHPAWTPLFFTAGALIAEIGGVLSHGAVVAREIGLPAVVGVEGATSLIATGRRVKVNARDGIVELL